MTNGKWRLCALSDWQEKPFFSESRAGIAAKGEPSTVVRNWYFDTPAQRDKALFERFEIKEVTT